MSEVIRIWMGQTQEWVVAASDYDELAAELAEIREVMEQMARNHYTTLMAGQTRIAQLEAQLAAEKASHAITAALAVSGYKLETKDVKA